MNASRSLLVSVALAATSTVVAAQDPVLSFNPSSPLELGTPLEVVVQGTPGSAAFVLFSDRLAPFPTPLGVLGIDPTTGTAWSIGSIPSGGELRYSCGGTVCDFQATQIIYYSQAVTLPVASPATGSGISNVVPLEFVTGDICPPCATNLSVDPNVSTCGVYQNAAFYLPGCTNARYRWITEGTFASYGDGTARLTGGIEQVDDVTKRFAVDLLFSGRQSSVNNNGTFPPPFNPVLDCVDPAVLAANGGTIDPDTWHYYTDVTGTFSGRAGFLGTDYDVTLRGPSVQVGIGASLKNEDYGLSGWLRLTRTNGSGGCGSVIEGDVNINLSDCR